MCTIACTYMPTSPRLPHTKTQTRGHSFIRGVTNMNYKSESSFTSVFRLSLPPFFFYFYVKHIVKGQWREAAEKEARAWESRVCFCVCVHACRYMCACVPVIMSAIPWCVCTCVYVCAFVCVCVCVQRGWGCVSCARCAHWEVVSCALGGGVVVVVGVGVPARGQAGGQAPKKEVTSIFIALDMHM